jgi:hypothetical protein
MLTEADLETTAERRLWDAIESGEWVDAEEQAVRAQLLVELLTTEQRPSGNRPRGLALGRARITGTLDLSALTLVCPLRIVDSDFDDGVSLDDAQVPRVNLSACRIPTLSARQLQTRGDARLDELETASLFLAGARIGGALTLRDAVLAGADGYALSGDRMEVREAAVLNGLRAQGEVSMIGARIGSQLFIEKAQLAHERHDALSLDGARVEGGVFANGLHAVGSVRLLGATIGGQLQLQGAVLAHAGGVALGCDSLVVEDVMAQGLQATGEVRFNGARIGAAIVLNGADLTSSTEHAFHADNVHVGASIFCDGVTVGGTFRLDRAEIGVSLGFQDARLSNGGEVALDAPGIEVGRHVFLGPTVIVEGDINLASARIGGTLVLDRATLSDSGKIDLTDARVRILADYAWPEASGELSATRPYEPRINGFKYERLASGTDDVATRLDWIAHAEQPYVPQPYEQLAAAYRAAGREEDARDVAIAKQRRKRGQLRLPGRMWNRFMDITVVYGYRTSRAVYALFAVMLAGWPIYAWASWNHLTPLKADDQLPQFEPLLYSIDAVLPVVTFGQESAWGATGAVLWWYAFSVLAGWILGTAFVAALTAMLNRT